MLVGGRRPAKAWKGCGVAGHPQGTESEGQVQLMGDKVEMFNWNMASGLLPSHPPRQAFPGGPPFAAAYLGPGEGQAGPGGRQRPPACL